MFDKNDINSQNFFAKTYYLVCMGALLDNVFVDFCLEGYFLATIQVLNALDLYNIVLDTYDLSELRPVVCL